MLANRCSHCEEEMAPPHSTCHHESCCGIILSREKNFEKERGQPKEVGMQFVPKTCQVEMRPLSPFLLLLEAVPKC